MSESGKEICRVISLSVYVCDSNMAILKDKTKSGEDFPKLSRTPSIGCDDCDYSRCVELDPNMESHLRPKVSSSNPTTNTIRCEPVTPGYYTGTGFTQSVKYGLPPLPGYYTGTEFTQPVKYDLPSLLDLQRRIAPDLYTFAFVLHASGLLQNLHSLAKALHAQLTKLGFLDDVIVHTTLSRTYARFGDFDGAKGVFQGSLFRDVVSYTAMIDVFAKAGEIDHARELFDEMPSSFRNVVSYTAMLDGLFRNGEIDRARELFHEMPSSFRNVVNYTIMIDGFSKAGEIDRAMELFDEMPRSLRNVVSHTAMIDGFFKNGQIGRARELFNDLPISLRNVVSYTTMIDGLFKAGEIDRAMELFDEMPSSLRDVVSYTAMIDGFSKNGEIDRARRLFHEMPSSLRNVVSYTAMIDGFFKTKEIDRARDLFDEMPSSLRNVNIYNGMIDGFFKAGEIDRARELFDEMPSSFRDVVSYNVMINGFVKAGEIDCARELFDRMPEKDVVCWGTLLVGYAKLNRCIEAIELFGSIMDLGMNFDRESLFSLLSACALLGKMGKGKETHGYIERNGIKLDACIGTALVDLYAKCGCIEMAKEVFRSCGEKDVTLWSAMLMGLAIHGDRGSVLQYLSRMLENGVKPNGVTILAVLVGCSHSGLINDAKRIFVEMESVHGVPREPKHYGCMVDLLARAGLIKEAREIIEGMPMGGDEVVWGALLGGCKKHGDVEGAEEAAKHMMQMKPDDGLVYSVMAHMYANSERWDDLVKVQRLKDSRGIKKSPGCSWIELAGITYKFFAGDCLHPSHLINSFYAPQRAKLASTFYFDFLATYVGVGMIWISVFIS
ncbi:hypothetical protein C2S52_018496 [Perilla frutescens var. hirtella]|nr:hypothetical protein C2S52_018496 [Perilla frutescens var. hirtella]